MPRVILSTQRGSYDVSQLAVSVQWSGDSRQVARTMRISILKEGAPDCPVGTAVAVSEGAVTLFSGFVFSRTGNTSSSTIDLTAYDHGIYLKRNQITRQYTGVTPEEATAALCKEFGIAVGSLAPTRVTVSRNFLAQSLYQVISTLYTLASDQTGVPYHIGMDGRGQLVVSVMDTTGPVVVIQPGSNLMDAATTESGDNIVNRVEVYDNGGNLLHTAVDAGSMEAYGVLQSVTRQSKELSPEAQAAQALKPEPEQRITINSLGDVRCISGGAVMIRDQSIGMDGLYWIESDNHQWRNGVYTSRLVVRLDRVVDRQSAGQ